MEQKNVKNIAKILISIFLVIKMHIKSAKLLKNIISIVNYDLKRKFHIAFANFDRDNNKKIEKAIATDKNNNNNIKDY